MSMQLDKVQPKNKDQLTQLINYAFKHNIYDLNFIDTSKITDMSNLFRYNNYNFDISNWDVSNVTDMNTMFYCCKIFDCDLSGWDVSNVIDMTCMFSWCNKFEGKGLEDWNISNVIKTSNMFDRCDSFDCDLSAWDVSKVIDMGYMFKNCKNFKGKGLNHWNLQSKIYSYNMFYGCDKIIIPNWYKSNI